MGWDIAWRMRSDRTMGIVSDVSNVSDVSDVSVVSLVFAELSVLV